MRWQLRRIVAAALVGCGSMASMTAGAQTSGSAISFARADGLVEKPLVKSAIDLSRATPLPLPSIDLPVTPEAILQLAQAPAPPSKPALDIHDTGNPSVAPLKWVGLVMTKTDQTHFSYCTGQFIAPRVVLTAGHCVKDTTTNTWHDVNAMSFILQYQNGEGSHVYKVVCTAALDAYSLPAGYSALNADQKNAAFLTAAQADFAMILVDGDSLTGTIPWQADWKGNWVGATRIGYPGDILGGEVIQQAHGIVFFADSIPIFASNGSQSPFPGLVVHWQSNTKLTQGSSGGGWIANFDDTEGPKNNIVIGVTSFNNTGFPGAMFGPYLHAAQVNSLLQFTTDGCKSK